MLPVIDHLTHFAYHPVLSNLIAGDIGYLGELVGRTS
jgi:hypothetical protein